MISIATPFFAVVYCLLLITDYLMQTQWLVNTWRAWHHFFAFSSLLCVHGLARRGRLPPWLVAITLLNFACLAYFEIVFAAFVTLLAAIYAGLILRRRPRACPSRRWTTSSRSVRARDRAPGACSV